MAGNNPRKFKDRIALLNQKQAESTEQFEVSSVILIKRWESEKKLAVTNIKCNNLITTIKLQRVI